MLRDYGSDITSEFINKATILLIKYLQGLEVTVSPSDYDLPAEGVKKIKNVLNYSKGKVEDLIEKFNKGKIQAYPGKTMR